MRWSTYAIMALVLAVGGGAFLLRARTGTTPPNVRSSTPSTPTVPEGQRNTGTLRVACRARSKVPNGPVTLVLEGNGRVISRPLWIGTVTLLDGIPEGTYRIEVLGSRPINCAPTGPLEIRSEMIRDLEVVLGREWIIAGRVSTADRRQLENVQFALDTLLEWTQVKLSDGRYALVIDDDGTAYTSSIRLKAKGYAYSQRAIELRTGQDLENVDFELVPGGTISGLVSSAGGKPVAGSVVKVFSKQYRDSAVVDFAGRYEITSVPFGAHIVEARALNHVGTTAPVELSEVAPNQVVDLRLDRGWTVRGYVYGAPGDNPIDGASIIADNARGTTDGRGYFELSGIKPSVTGRIHCVSAEAPGYGSASVMETLPEETIRLRLHRAIQVNFKITNVPDSCLDGVNVQFRRKDQSPSEVQIQPDKGLSGLRAGIHHIDLTAGTYDVMATAGGLTVYKRTDLILGSESAPSIAIELDGIDPKSLKRGEAISKEWHELTSRFMKEASTQPKSAREALWNALQERLKVLEEERKNLERSLER